VGAKLRVGADVVGDGEGRWEMEGAAVVGDTVGEHVLEPLPLPLHPLPPIRLPLYPSYPSRLPPLPLLLPVLVGAKLTDGAEVVGDGEGRCEIEGAAVVGEMVGEQVLEPLPLPHPLLPMLFLSLRSSTTRLIFQDSSWTALVDMAERRRSAVARRFLWIIMVEN